MGIKNIIGNLTVDGNLVVNDELTVNGKAIPTSTSQLANDSGFISGNPTNDANVKTKYRIAKQGYTNGASRYYKLCTLPVNNSSNYASVIISGRIGGWESGNMSYINALVWNRGTPSISVIDIAGTAPAMSSIWGIGDLALYVESDNSATLYILCKNYFTFDLNIELYQSTGAIVYNGTYTTSPSGTSTALASQAANRLELCNGKAIVGGSELSITNVVKDNTTYVKIGSGATKKDSKDIVIGYNAVASNSGGSAILIGPNAKNEKNYAYGSITIGDTANGKGTNAVAIGRNSIAGSHSTALGDAAECNNSYASAIGYGAVANAYSSDAIGVGAETSSTDENIMQLGGSVSALRCDVALSVTSDERDKTDIKDINNALDFITKLKPITFVNNERKLYISEEDKKSETYRKYGMCEYDREAHARGTKKGSRRRVGLLAQETQQVLKDIYGTDNYANIVNDNFYDLEERPEDVENKLTLAYANLVPFLISAIKEQQAQIEELKNKLK